MGHKPGNALSVEGLQRKLGPLSFFGTTNSVYLGKDYNLSDAMTQSPLHIVFSPSGAGLLLQALADAGRDDRLISLFDDLSFGPINPSDPQLRARWVETELGDVTFVDSTSASPPFWNEVLTTTRRRIIWTSRRSAMEYAGFLECMWRLADRPCDVIDLTDHTTSFRPAIGPPTRPRPIVSLGFVSPRQFNEEGLYDTAVPLSGADCENYRSSWERLQSENAPLRVIENGALISAPVTYFDSLLMAFVTHEWTRAMRVVGEALAAQDDDTWQTGDLFLRGRLKAFVSEGRIEARSSWTENLRSVDIRLPQP